MTASQQSHQSFHYVGTELDLFAAATRWKSYWSGAVSPYLGTNVLDVGAGIGATARYLCTAQHRWLALEPDAGLAERMRRSAPSNCEVRTGTIATAIEPRAQFDTILYIDVLEHIEDDAAELRLASKHLMPGGRLIVLSPAHSFLFTPFDAAIGHFRRYNRASLRGVTPPSLRVERIFYLDSVGMLASLGNRLVLNASTPSNRQIAVWDKCMVPVSRVIDPLTAYRLGKSIVAVWAKADHTEP